VGTATIIFFAQSEKEDRFIFPSHSESRHLLNIFDLWFDKVIPKSQVNGTPNQRINADGKNDGGLTG